MIYGSSIECNWFASIAIGITLGGLASALHAFAYGWLMRRIGKSAVVGVLLSVLPLVGTLSWAISLVCPETADTLWSDILWYGSFAYFIMFFLNLAVFIWFFFPIVSIGASVVTGSAVFSISLVLAVPFLGALFALFWIALSWNLPELLGIRRNGRGNPPTLRGKLITAASILYLILLLIFVFNQ